MGNMCCKGEVNGKFVSNIQIDTGACRTVVREDLVSRWIWKDSIEKLRIADNTNVKCPVADVIIKTGNNTYQIEAAIVRQLRLICSLEGMCCLGNMLEYTLECMETDEIKQTLQRILQKRALNPKAIVAEVSEKYVLAVETRAQKIKRLEKEFQMRNLENACGGKPSSFRTYDIEDVQSAMSENSVVSSEKSAKADVKAAMDSKESKESTITEEDEENPFDSFSEELFGESRPHRETLSKAQKRHRCIQRRTQHQEMKIGELEEQDPELGKLEEGDKTCRSSKLKMGNQLDGKQCE